MPGTITLYNNKEEPIKVMVYLSRLHRTQIIEQWARIKAGAYYQIDPELPEDLEELKKAS